MISYAISQIRISVIYISQRIRRNMDKAAMNRMNQSFEKEILTMQTAAAYIRVSTEDQIEYSPDSQLKKIQEYARIHNILLPEDFIFLDEGISGRSARRRPAFLKMIGMAKQKPRPFDLILVWKFSRFARSRQDSILYKSMLRKDCGINVISITEQLSDDPTAILIEALLEAMDEYYSINLAQEVRRGMNEKFSRGGVVSIPPFGYRMGTEHFEPDPEKAPFIPMIYQNFLNGMSFRQIAVQLNELGIRTSRSNRFEGRTVEYILSNPAYLGKLRRSMEDPSVPPDIRHRRGSCSMHTVDGHHTALVEPEIFYAVQQKISELRKSHPAPSRTAPACYMLHGLVRCSNCGSTLTLSEKGRSLQCHRYAKGLCSQSHHIRLEILNRAVLSGLEADLDKYLSGSESDSGKSMTALKSHISHRIITVRSTHKPTGSRSQSVVFSHLLNQEYRRQDRIQAAYEAGIDTLEEYRKKKAASIKQIQKLKSEIAKQAAADSRLPGHVQFSLADIPELLKQDAMTQCAKNELLKAFLSHITFCRSENTIQIHYRT